MSACVRVRAANAEFEGVLRRAAAVLTLPDAPAAASPVAAATSAPSVAVPEAAMAAVAVAPAAERDDSAGAGAGAKAGKEDKPAATKYGQHRFCALHPHSLFSCCRADDSFMRT